MNFSFLNSFEPMLISANRIHSGIDLNTTRSFGSRKVECLELDYITWGNGLMITDGHETPAVQGTLFVRVPGMVVEGILPYHCYFLRLAFSKDESTLTDTMKEYILPDDFPKVISFDNPMPVENLFSRTYNEYLSQNDASPFIIKACLMQIFLLIFDEWNTNEKFKELSKTAETGRKKLLSVASFMEDNVHEHYTLEELSDMSGYSRYAFCRKFKDMTGETPINYMNRCKINHVKKLLLETDMSVKEIMFSCGFKNEPYFFILFKRHVGCSPLEFRIKNKVW